MKMIGHNHFICHLILGTFTEYPLYTTIATVTINLIVAVAIILLNLYVAVSTGCRLPPLVLSMHFPDVAASIYVEAVPAVPHE